MPDPCPELRLGFRLLHGFSAAHADQIVRARASGPFTSVHDFTRRTNLARPALLRLADADAFGSLGGDRRQSLWEVLGQDDRPRVQPLFAGLTDDELPVELPSLSPLEQVFADYRAAGLSLRGHPIAFCRADLDQLGVLPAERLVEELNNRPVSVAGLVLLRQRPSTAKGITFVTLEDETGVANLVIRQAIWDRFYTIARRSPAWIAQGKLEAKDSVIHVVVQRIEDLSLRVNELRTKSRDFR